MSDMIPLECPRCRHTWEKSLRALQRVDDIYRLAKGAPQPLPAPGKIANYRDQCPICGTYVIATVEAD